MSGKAREAGLSGLLHSRRMRLQKDQNGVCACSIEDSAALRISRFRSFIRVDLGGIQAALLLQPISTIERRTYLPLHSPGRVSGSSALRQFFITVADTTNNQTKYLNCRSTPPFLARSELYPAFVHLIWWSDAIPEETSLTSSLLRVFLDIRRPFRPGLQLPPCLQHRFHATQSSATDE